MELHVEIAIQDMLNLEVNMFPLQKSHLFSL